MMHELEKSDLCVVAVKSANKFAQARRSRWSEGEGPRGTLGAEHVPDFRAG
jgi:hypothetical protein